MQKPHFLITLVLSFLANLAIAQPKIDAKKLDKKLEALRELTQTAGFSVAVVYKDEILYTKGFGYRDVAQKLKADEHTLYPIGSSSKAFTTALLGIMEEEHDFSFEVSPREYLPNLKFYNDELNNKVTVLDMISHRTGLPRHDYSWYLFPTQNRDSLLARVEYQEPFTGLREKWYYNNFMYLAQGMISEKLTDKTWEDNIREYFLAPLDMKSSNVSIAELQKSANAAKGYRLQDFEETILMPYYDIAAMGPAGAINSSVYEMSNWLKLWLNEGKYNDQQIIPKSYIARAQNPLMLLGKGVSDPQFPGLHLNSYGYAWFTSSFNGHYRMEHGGNIDGFSANVCLFPSDDIGIVVLCNQNTSALPGLARNLISEMVLGLEETDWHELYEKQINEAKESMKKMEDQAPEETVYSGVAHNLVDYQGYYYHPGYGKFKIYLQNDSLYARFPLDTSYLKPLHYDIFEAYAVENNRVDTSGGSGEKINFQTNDLGDIASVKIKMEAMLDPIVFDRSPLDLKMDASDLEQFVGNYTLAGTNLKVSVKDGVLRLFVPSQPEYSLTPISKNEFSIKGLTGYKVRFETRDGKEEIVLLQPNGTFRAEKEG